MDWSIQDMTIAGIRWSSDDLYVALDVRLGRKPTDAEMEYYMSAIQWDVLEDRSIELGWEILGDLISMAGEPPKEAVNDSGDADI